MARFRLLCVTAHPDDEAASFGGTLLRYSETGVAETFVICLTAGAAGSHRGGASDDAALMAMRQRELQRASEILKVNHSEVLGYTDGGLPSENLLTVVADLTARIRRVRPHVVITMGPEGSVTAHPDHSMVGIFTTLAFQWAGRSNRFPEQLTNGLAPWRAQKLYFGTAPFTMEDRQPIAPSPITCEIDIAPYLERKIAAFKAHTSQEPLFEYFENVTRRQGDKEYYHLVSAHEPQTVKVETDVFAGVEPE